MTSQLISAQQINQEILCQPNVCRYKYNCLYIFGWASQDILEGSEHHGEKNNNTSLGLRLMVFSEILVQ